RSLWPEKRFDPSVGQRGLWWPFRKGPERLESGLERLFPSRLSRAARLARTMELLKPDIIHSFVIISGGYLTLAAQSYLRGPLPPWVVSNWGCDLHLFGRLEEHRRKVHEVLAKCDYYMAECHRDIDLAWNFGFKGTTLPVVPMAGVFDLQRISAFRQAAPSSARRLIVLKGYQDWHGRALVALRAIELAADRLAGYRVAIFFASRSVRIAAELMSQRTKIPVEIVPFSDHEDILRLHGQARISLGASISDGIPTSLIEAMAMGSFPIQSDTSCANEWVIHGKTGFIVPAEDPQAVAEAIRLAVSDDKLVDAAAKLNWDLALERLDSAQIRRKVVGMYNEVASG